MCQTNALFIYRTQAHIYRCSNRVVIVVLEDKINIIMSKSLLTTYLTITCPFNKINSPLCFCSLMFLLVDLENNHLLFFIWSRLTKEQAVRLLISDYRRP